jgi:hypothetical protein
MKQEGRDRSLRYAELCLTQPGIPEISRASPPPLYTGLATLARAFAPLSVAPVRGPAWFSFGMARPRPGSATSVANRLADLLGQKFDTAKQRRREGHCGAQAQAGARRRPPDVRTCFAPLPRWVLADGPSQQLAPALDATGPGQRFATPDISALYRGCAVPLARRILPAREDHPWKDEGPAPLKGRRRELPGGGAVAALTDRGLCAKGAVPGGPAPGRASVPAHQQQRLLPPPGEKRRRPLRPFVPPEGARWRGGAGRSRARRGG